MRRVFADSLYWITLSSSRDQWHRRAVAASRALVGSEVVTTDEVLVEFLAAFRYNASLRSTASGTVDDLGGDRAVLILPQSHQSFLEGLFLYKARPDKKYSLTDCISMATMRREGISEVLTHDAHFAQDGFVTLL